MDDMVEMIEQQQGRHGPVAGRGQEIGLADIVDQDHLELGGDVDQLPRLVQRDATAGRILDQRRHQEHRGAIAFA